MSSLALFHNIVMLTVDTRDPKTALRACVKAKVVALYYTRNDVSREFRIGTHCGAVDHAARNTDSGSDEEMMVRPSVFEACRSRDGAGIEPRVGEDT
jgi:hypothetical protein